MHVELITPDGRPIDFFLDYDSSFVADNDTKACVNHFGTCEPEVTELMLRVLREGDRVIDVGANIGFFTILMSKLVGPVGKVTAFEPAPVNIAKLLKNIAINSVNNAVVEMFALSDGADMLPFRTFHIAAASGMSSLGVVDDEVATVDVSVTTLDAYHFKNTRLLKIDAEGSEDHILRGGDRLLRYGVPFVVCELNQKALQRRDSNTGFLRKRMEARGYEMFFLSDDGALPCLIPAVTKAESNKENLNVLFSTVEDVGLAWPEVRI